MAQLQREGFDASFATVLAGNKAAAKRRKNKPTAQAVGKIVKAETSPEGRKNRS
jgi:hypothetical protein